MLENQSHSNFFEQGTYSSLKEGKFANVPDSRWTILLFAKSLEENKYIVIGSSLNLALI